MMGDIQKGLHSLQTAQSRIIAEKPSQSNSDNDAANSWGATASHIIFYRQTINTSHQKWESPCNIERSVSLYSIDTSQKRKSPCHHQHQTDHSLGGAMWAAFTILMISGSIPRKKWSYVMNTFIGSPCLMTYWSLKLALRMSVSIPLQTVRHLIRSGISPHKSTCSWSSTGSLVQYSRRAMVSLFMWKNHQRQVVFWDTQFVCCVYPTTWEMILQMIWELCLPEGSRRGRCGNWWIECRSGSVETNLFD